VVASRFFFLPAFEWNCRRVEFHDQISSICPAQVKFIQWAWRRWLCTNMHIQFDKGWMERNPDDGKTGRIMIISLSQTQSRHYYCRTRAKPSWKVYTNFPARIIKIKLLNYSFWRRFSKTYLEISFIYTKNNDRTFRGPSIFETPFKKLILISDLYFFYDMLCKST